MVLIYNKYTTFNTCLECKEEIFNPICPLCLANSIKQWLNNKKIDNKESKDAVKLKLLENYINNLMKNNEKFASNSTLCIKCKNESVYLCPYCFTEIILNKLKQIKASKKLKQEFFELFNFDLEHKGYSKEFEEEI